MTDSLEGAARNAAEAVIIAKRDLLTTERANLLERRSEILARLRKVHQEIADCRAAARLFSLDIDFPADDPADAQREALIIGQHDMVMRRARELAAAAQRAESTVEGSVQSAVKRGELSAASVSAPAEMPLSPLTGTMTSTLGSRPALREILLEQLKLAGSEGSKAALLRDYFQRSYGAVIHEKTVGMTLYRLLKDGLVHRDGHTWFFGPASVESENPGGETPGFVTEQP
jgi:hypothetical protein